MLAWVASKESPTATRRNLLDFEEIDLPGEINITHRQRPESHRLLHLEQVAAISRIPPLMQRLLAGDRDPVVAEVFTALWQDRVRRILIDQFDDPNLISLR